MEDQKNNQPLDRAATFATGVSQTVTGAKKAGEAIAGTALGTASGGPFGMLISFAITKKTFWKLSLSVLLATLLFIAVIVNLYGILLARFGLMDADGYVQSAKQQEVADVQERIETLMMKEPKSFELLFEMLDEKQEVMLEEIKENYQSNYQGRERYEMKLTDEYEELLKPEFSRYLAVLFAGTWNGSQIRSFLQNGTTDLYETDLVSDYDLYFDQAAEIYGVPSALLKAVAKVESNFRTDAVSGAGAVGVMQLMPVTAKSLGVADPYDPEQNIYGGAKYLSDSMAVFSGYENWTELVIASYHAGVGAVKKAGYQVPQNGQTPAYVEKVLSHMTLAESGSLTPGREGKLVSSDQSLQMLLKEVEDRKDKLFYWVKEGVFEEERQRTVYYLGQGEDREEISRTAYEAWKKIGVSTLSTGIETEIWHVVSYRIVNLLDGELSESESEYSYKYVTTVPRFLQALEMLKFLISGLDRESFFEKFSWKELVFGEGPTDLSYATDVQTDGETIAYETAEGCQKEVVYFNQTEEPWAFTAFCGTTVKAAGCGPTAMAMVISTLTGQTVTPREMAAYTETKGLYVPGKGTSHSLPGMAAKNWGLSVKRLSDRKLGEVKEALKQGAMAVVICGEYTITGSGSGHYIVLTGVTEEGFFTVADPASRTRSGRIYSMDTIGAYARDLDAGSIWVIW